MTSYNSIKEVSKTSCSQSCEDKINKYHEQNELLVREVSDLKNEIYEIKKTNKPLKEKLDAQNKDLTRIRDEYSTKRVHHHYAKEEISKLTVKLDALKAKFKDSEFNFKKIDVSSEIVESIIEKRLKWKDK